MKANRADFPILKTMMNGKPLVYLDSSSSSQKPQVVIDAFAGFYEHHYANVHRGVYALSQKATDLYEAVRDKVQHFIGALHREEIIFTRGTTEAINLVAQSYGRANLAAGDEIILSAMEHHSNIVPWQLLAEQTGAVLRVIPISDAGEIDFEAFTQLLNERTKILTVTHASNVLGTINPIKEMVECAHQAGVVTVVDGAQAFPHMPVNVRELNCDFYAFSAHKAYGPTGIGVLYGKRALLDKMPPYQGGGDMIETVSFERTTFNKLPAKFEAGTPAIAEVVAFGAALNYLEQHSMASIAAHEQELLAYAMQALSTIKGLRVIGTAQHKVGVISFVLDSAHAHDVGTVLDANGIAVRAGHHCAMPLMERFKVPATLRVSFGIYNTHADIDALILGLQEVERLFG